MGNLKINLDEITILGKKMKEECYNFKNSIKSVKSDIDILVVAWKGADSQAYSKKMDLLISEMNREEIYLEHFANFFITNAENYRIALENAKHQIAGFGINK